MQSNLKLLFNKILIRLTEFKQHKATKLSNARAVSLHRDAPRHNNKNASLFCGCLFPFALDRPTVKIVAGTLFVRKVLRSFSFIDFVRSGSKKKCPASCQRARRPTATCGPFRSIRRWCNAGRRRSSSAVALRLSCPRRRPGWRFASGTSDLRRPRGRTASWSGTGNRAVSSLRELNTKLKG